MNVRLGSAADVDRLFGTRQQEHLKTIAAVAVILMVAMPAVAANHRKVSPQDIAAAVNKADAVQVPYRKSKLLPADVRSAKWLAIDGNGWRVID